MNRTERDWPAVRAAVDAHMREVRLSTAELARQTRMSETTIRAFRKRGSRPCGLTITGLNEGLGLPRGYPHAIAEGRTPAAPGLPARTDPDSTERATLRLAREADDTPRQTRPDKDAVRLS
jgi:hypothetical protein